MLATHEWFYSVVRLVMIQYQPMWTLRRPKVNSLWRDRLLTLSNKIPTVHLRRTRLEPVPSMVGVVWYDPIHHTTLERMVWCSVVPLVSLVPHGAPGTV
jgi:hypothetical protein